MAEKKYLDYSGTDLLWRKILKLVNKKLDSVTNSDDSIRVSNSREIAVNISQSENNLLQLKPGEGLYVEAPQKMHVLRFGANQIYVYDGSQDVTVPVYMGEIHE